MRAFDATSPSFKNLPYSTWVGLTFIAVVGSLIYGASLSLVFPQWRLSAGAIWFALSAGLGWCVFGPMLLLLTRRNAFTCAHACLVTMAYGEAVLVSGATVNALLRLTGITNPTAFNVVCVALSNVIMAATLSLQLQAIGVPVWKTLLAWMVILNGSGAMFFYLFLKLL
jgi:hypothetical protein